VALRSGNGAKFALETQLNQRQLARGRDLHQGQGQVGRLHRAVDSTGATIDFLLSAKRDTFAAKRFLAKALGGVNHPHLWVINTDKDAAYPPAIVQVKTEGALEENGGHRQCNISTVFWNRMIGRSSAGAARVSIFASSGELGARSPATRPCT
jgi:transposase-like protein